jgi:nucleotide-binding universal stress UspA family protein
MKLLVLTSEPITAVQLRDALPDGTGPEDAEVMVVAPALQDDALHFWLSDADDAIAKADEVRRATLATLDAEGVQASGDTGESDPVAAIADALQTFDADRIVLFTHGRSQQRYREDLDLEEVRERFGLPVDQRVL